MRDGSNVTCIYRLLANKRQDVYETVFQRAMEFVGFGDPKLITRNFEITAINVANRVFDASNTYCFFSPEPIFFKCTTK